ncbi:unnamed protein product, partial [Allacma fusca]
MRSDHLSKHVKTHNNGSSGSMSIPRSKMIDSDDASKKSVGGVVAKENPGLESRLSDEVTSTTSSDEQSNKGDGSQYSTSSPLSPSSISPSSTPDSYPSAASTPVRSQSGGEDFEEKQLLLQHDHLTPNTSAHQCSQYNPSFYNNTNRMEESPNYPYSHYPNNYPRNNNIVPNNTSPAANMINFN